MEQETRENECWVPATLRAGWPSHCLLEGGRWTRLGCCWSRGKIILFGFLKNRGSVRYRRRYENIIFLFGFIIIVVGRAVHVKVIINVETVTLRLPTTSLQTVSLAVVKVKVKLLERLVHDAPLGLVILWSCPAVAHEADHGHRQAPHGGGVRLVEGGENSQYLSCCWAAAQLNEAWQIKPWHRTLPAWERDKFLKSLQIPGWSLDRCSKNSTKMDRFLHLSSSRLSLFNIRTDFSWGHPKYLYIWEMV